MKKRRYLKIISLFLCLSFFCNTPLACRENHISHAKSLELSDVPAWVGRAYVEVNGNKASFSKKQKSKKSYFLKYYDQDEYGRPIKAFACLGAETLNDKEREGLARSSLWDGRQKNIRILLRTDMCITDAICLCRLQLPG